MSILASLALWYAGKKVKDFVKSSPDERADKMNDNLSMVKMLGSRINNEQDMADALATLLASSPATSGMLPGMATGWAGAGNPSGYAYGVPATGGPLQNLFQRLGQNMGQRQDDRQAVRDFRGDLRDDRRSDGRNPAAPVNPPIMFNGQVPPQAGAQALSVGQFVPANQSGLWEGKRVFNILPMGRITIASGAIEEFSNEPARDCVLRDAVFAVEGADPADYEPTIMADLSITNVQVGADSLFVTGAGTTEAPLSMLLGNYCQYISGYVAPNRQKVSVDVFNAGLTDHDVVGGFWVELVSQVR